jgi:hypothetical protein
VGLNWNEGITTAQNVGQGFFPLDQQLKVEGQQQSERVSKLSVWLSGLVPFERAAEILEQVGRIETSRGSVWQRASTWGSRFQAEEKKAQNMAAEVDWRSGIGMGKTEEAKRMGVSMDGGMIHIRDEGWKETKIGCVFEVGKEIVMDEQTREEVEVGCAKHNTYVAHLGEPGIFGQKVWAEAKRRGWMNAADTQVVGDGAVWIWNLAAEHFYDSQQVVDWYHGKEHLAHAAELLHGEGTLAMQRWLKEEETSLFQGHADEIAHRIRQRAQGKPVQEALSREAGYFEHNQHRMDYLEMRIQGWVIGSGMVESGAKQFKARLAGPGMHWSRTGAERLLAIRSAILSDRFDQIWHSAYISPQN